MASLAEFPEGTVLVRVTAAEYDYAANVGVRRNRVCHEQHRRNRDGRALSPTFDTNCVGALGEFVAHKAYGLPWRPDVGGWDTDEGDMPPAPDGTIRQVRTTTMLDGGLVVYPNERADHVYLLVVLDGLVGYLVGWATGEEAKRYPIEPAWGRLPERHVMPQDDLHPCTRARRLVSAAS